MTIKSLPHYHTSDSACLEAIREVPQELGPLPMTEEERGRIALVAVEDGWYRCKERRAYYVHDHGGHFVSHYPRDRRAGCPA
jgi:hypothetical protein